MPPLIDTPVGPRGMGLVPAPFNARSLRFRLIPDPAAVTVDWNAAPSLRSWLTPVEDQGQEGSCVAHACTSAVEMLRQMRGLSHVPLCRNWVYFWGRVKAGLIDRDNPATWLDTGCWGEAGFDVQIAGSPAESLDPYIPDATRRPPTFLDADAPNQDDLLSHHPIFRDDPGGLGGGLIVALQAFMPVALGMFWIGDYSWPDARGFIPPMIGVGAAGGHEILCWKRIPAGVVGPDWYAVARNSWGAGWTAGRQFPDPEMEPGDFLIPGALFDNGTVFDLRAASFEAVPQPEPDEDRAERILAALSTRRGEYAAAYQANRRSQTKRAAWQASETMYTVADAVMR